jgi:two-component system sensor histidine kinase KdpD
LSDPCLDTLRVLGHELRRPLTVIRGASTLLIDDSDRLPAGSRVQMLAMIDRSATAMSDLIDDLLTAVHLELGDVMYAPEALDVQALVAEAVDAARYEDPEREVSVGGVDGLEAEADHEHALRVLRSLLINGIRYSPGTGAVEVAAGARGDRVELSVLDRGPGIPAAYRERAFEKYTRLDPNTGGAGLGLFLARGLARGMGGDVTVADREGGGTAVCFTLRRRA